MLFSGGESEVREGTPSERSSCELCVSLLEEAREFSAVVL